MVADFWTFAPQGHWPFGSVIFLVFLVVANIWAIRNPKERHIPRPHLHSDALGKAHMCYHHCKQHGAVWYCDVLTIAFPLEHIVYHKLWPFYQLSGWLNIS